MAKDNVKDMKKLCVHWFILLAIPFFVGIVVLKKQEAQHDNDKQATRVLWCAGRIANAYIFASGRHKRIRSKFAKKCNCVA